MRLDVKNEHCCGTEVGVRYLVMSDRHEIQRSTPTSWSGPGEGLLRNSPFHDL